jgi:hypothetical protein
MGQYIVKDLPYVVHYQTPAQVGTNMFTRADLPKDTIVTVTSLINNNPLNAQGQPVGDLPTYGNAEALYNGSLIKFSMYPTAIMQNFVKKHNGGRRKSNRNRRNRRNRHKSRRLRR